MTLINALKRDERGTAVIEMSIALPVLIMIIWGIFQVGIAFQASAGMQHALGEGARLATLCYNPDPDTGCETPTDADIIAKVNQKVFGSQVGTFNTPTLTDGPAGSESKILSVTFTMTPNFLFFNAPPVTLTRTKQIYMAN